MTMVDRGHEGVSEGQELAGALQAFFERDSRWGRRVRVELAGSGLDFLVFRLSHDGGPDIAVKMPRSLEFQTDNDGVSSARSVLDKEVAITTALGRWQFPVARLIGL